MERGERIRILRVAKGWNQTQLAAAVRAAGAFRSASYLSKIESGQAGAVSVDTFEAIATALEVPADTILTTSYDNEIVQDPIDFMRRHSLEKAAAKHELPKDEADALRKVERAIRRGPVTVEDWEIVRAYGIAYGEVLRKPGAKSGARHAAKPRQSPPRGAQHG